MTSGTLVETADGMDLKKMENLRKQLLDGTFEWTDIARKMIPKPGKKKKRPLGIPNFTDRIVQECIRIILNIIYEPVFQIHESNHGFRPRRSTQTAVIKLQRESKEMDFALEGDISGAYDNVNHKKLIEILKKKIIDEKFLKLIEKGLNHNIKFEGKTLHNIVGTPQGGIASPILFNIYMEEFDQFIRKNLEKTSSEMNLNPLRKKSGTLTTESRRVKSRIEKAKEKIRKIRLKKNLTQEDRREIILLAIKMRENKKRLIQINSVRKNSLLIRFSYSRYADDFILISNAPEETMKRKKKEISEWLEEELKMKLDSEKTLLTNLHREKAKYLGFTVFRKKKRIIRKVNKNGIVFRQRSTTDITLGIDHERIKERLIAGKILDKKHKPRSNPIYQQQRPYYIILKYKQRIEGLYNYYCVPITYMNELNHYHYIYKFSCLKTLARRMNISSKAITLKYGRNLTMQEPGIKKGKNKKIRTVSYPSYAEITRKSKNFKEKEKRQMFIRIKKKGSERKTYLENISMNEITSTEWATHDPFSMNNIAVNLRTLYQLKTHCSVCGCEASPERKIVMHHVKHIRKGKVSGFTKHMKGLNRKSIPVCNICHLKIHKGEYDGKKLKDLYDIELILA